MKVGGKEFINAEEGEMLPAPQEAKVPETFFVSSYKSPLGTYTLVSSHRGIIRVGPEERAERRLARWIHNGIRLERGEEHNATLAREFDAYFAGKLRKFTVPLDLRGTAFQLRVWQLLCEIPYGETRSYGQIAQAMGNPKATRAVGQANGSNPISIIVPCHRVIGSDGGLTGYGGGLHRKRALLDLESAALRSKLP
jgi:methylated-DNA-[protein]-cysteine S-methyltransferase